MVDDNDGADLEELRKDELIEEAEERGLPTSGTKDELISRILMTAVGPGEAYDYDGGLAIGEVGSGGQAYDYDRIWDPEEE
jgi:hypothetical protein